MERVHMPRAASCLLLSLLVVACAPAEDLGPTRQALANAQTAQDAVSQLTLRYGEILVPPGSAPGTPARGWDEATAFLESPEGVATTEFLGRYAIQFPVAKAHPRYREIDELSRVTVEMVKLALAPRGTWESFSLEMKAVRTRLDSARAALEKGTKSFVLVVVWTKTEEDAKAFSEALAKARASGAAKKEGAEKAP
jgi:hypothetical protein